MDGSPDYEEALTTFVRSAFFPADIPSSSFLYDVHHFVARIARAGFWNALARTLIQFTSPGTPDLYQGDELWNLSLVDPDNRRPVDYELRKNVLDQTVIDFERPETRPELLGSLLDGPEDGRIKLHVIRSALHARREHPELFASGDYQRLSPVGPAADHLFCFSRKTQTEQAIVAVPRLTVSLVDAPSQPPLGHVVWSETEIPLPEALQWSRWTSVLTGESLQPQTAMNVNRFSVADLFQTLPIALLIGESDRPSE